MILDVTTTAVARPDIVDRTYRSFTQRLHGVDWKESTCYINIDPLPINVDRNEVVEVAKKYFGNVKANMPDKPNYTAAYNWVWSHAQTEYILNLEDDWELNIDIPIDALISYFNSIPTLHEVVFRAYSYRYPTCCTSPSILKRSFYSAIGGKLDINRNPENQLHCRTDFGVFLPNRKNCSSPENYVIAYPLNQFHVIVSDIGREWLDRSKYIRPEQLNPNDPRYLRKSKFVHWIEK